MAGIARFGLDGVIYIFSAAMDVDALLLLLGNPWVLRQGVLWVRYIVAMVHTST